MMLTLYRLVLYLAFPVVVVRLIYRALRNRDYLDNIPQRFGFAFGFRASDPDLPPERSAIWIHAVSVGEVNAAVPLVRWLREACPDRRIVITNMTPTGAERVRRLFGDSVGDGLEQCYLPYDYPGAVNRLLDHVRPGLAIVMETEIWPNLICSCSKRHIPMLYANVRLSARSFEGYRRFGRFIGQVIPRIDRMAVQSEADAERIVALGADPARVSVTGSIKFEIEVQPSLTEAAQSVRRNLGWDRPVWVVGSTHEGEDEQVLDAFDLARQACPDLLMVLAPRHPERFGAVHRLCVRRGFNVELRSANFGELDGSVDIYLTDTMGELTLMIAASDFAFIGGSLVPTGGHNVLEACSSGVAVIFGPHMFNFQEISDQVLSRGAGIQVTDSQELADVVERLVNDAVLRDGYGTEGRRFVEENRGALDSIRKILAEIDQP